MRTPVIVDTPYPTVWETAKLMGVSKKRTRELIKIADEALARWREKKEAELAVARKKRRQHYALKSDATKAEPASGRKKRLKTA